MRELLLVGVSSGHIATVKTVVNGRPVNAVGIDYTDRGGKLNSAFQRVEQVFLDDLFGDYDTHDCD